MKTEDGIACRQLWLNGGGVNSLLRPDLPERMHEEVWWNVPAITENSRLRQADRWEFETSLGYTVFVLKKKKPGEQNNIMVHACNPSMWAVATEGSGVQGQPHYTASLRTT